MIQPQIASEFLDAIRLADDRQRIPVFQQRAATRHDRLLAPDDQRDQAPLGQDE